MEKVTVASWQVTEFFRGMFLPMTFLTFRVFHWKVLLIWFIQHDTKYAFLFCIFENGWKNPTKRIKTSYRILLCIMHFFRNLLPLALLVTPELNICYPVCWTPRTRQSNIFIRFLSSYTILLCVDPLPLLHNGKHDIIKVRNVRWQTNWKRIAIAK